MKYVLQATGGDTINSLWSSNNIGRRKAWASFKYKDHNSRFRDSYYNKTVVTSSSLDNGDTYTGKTTFVLIQATGFHILMHQNRPMENVGLFP